jgi:alkylhydroperoxidase/carboxymuconolactone decarboxylase family protein YurZ
VNSANPAASLSPLQTDRPKEVDKLQECVNAIIKSKDTIRGEIRTLLRFISSRDQIYVANRKALQSLDRECKHMVVIALKALTRRETEVDFPFVVMHLILVSFPSLNEFLLFTFSLH